ncbi:hypothetical protein MD484_g1582, partial [Candolleomyces efflorescens]
MSVQIERYDGPKTGRYIVTFKDDVMGVNFYEPLAAAANEPIRFAYQWDTVFNGFAAELNEAALNHLQNAPGVESISEDVIMHTFNTQTDAPWGLARLSSKSSLGADSKDSDLNFSYTYDSSAGAGVDVYVVDTGVRVSHADLGGRARWANVFGGHAWQDGNGHGTHVAGTIAGERYGVAKQANILAVKVLGDDGSGATSDIIAGLNFVLSQFNANGQRPTVVNMSLGGRANVALDKAVQALVAAGVHVVLAAGNESQDARNVSPARVKEAITVGASTISDAQASFSNFGSLVDLFAPGHNIISCGFESDTASPHVAGLVAYLLKLNSKNNGEGNVLTPAALAQRLKDLALKGVLTSITAGTGNLLAQNA